MNDIPDKYKKSSVSLVMRKDKRYEFKFNNIMERSTK
jgi:hypothetical protein